MHGFMVVMTTSRQCMPLICSQQICLCVALTRSISSTDILSDFTADIWIGIISNSLHLKIPIYNQKERLSLRTNAGSNEHPWVLSEMCKFSDNISVNFLENISVFQLIFQASECANMYLFHKHNKVTITLCFTH